MKNLKKLGKILTKKEQLVVKGAAGGCKAQPYFCQFTCEEAECCAFPGPSGTIYGRITNGLCCPSSNCP